VARATELDDILLNRAIIVCCGSGGVGKTTLSAVLALRAATLGKKALVCTIDPAKRLANSLGLDSLSGSEHEVSRKTLKKHGVTLGEGSLWAMMLDTKRTFDRLIEKYASSEEARDRILNNGFYQRISSQVAGSQEYMAMEKLYEIHTEGDYDLIILDTPPNKNALDFLEAPSRMTDFLQVKVLSWFMKPTLEAGKLGASLLRRGTATVMRFIDRIIGLDFLNEVREFFSAFEGMYDGFKDRAGQVYNLLRDPETTGFILVTSPQTAMVDDALFFYQRLQKDNMPVVSVIANRVHPDPVQWEGVNGLLADTANERLKRENLIDALQKVFEDRTDLAECGVSLADAFLELHNLAKRDHESLARLYKVVGKQSFIFEIPALEWDVHDIRGLSKVGQVLFESETEL